MKKYLILLLLVFSGLWLYGQSTSFPFSPNGGGSTSFTPQGSSSGGTVTRDTPYTNVTYAATITNDWNLGSKQSITLTGNLSLANPIGTSAFIDGNVLELRFIQDATGGRVVTFTGNLYTNTQFISLANLVNTNANTFSVVQLRCNIANGSTNYSPFGYSGRVPGP